MQLLCPVSVVQRIYTEPQGLFESQAHLQKQPITQSMCRVSTPNGVQSNCVGCLSPCPDIDLERAYWQTIETPGRRFAYYGYFGLVWAFYTYYFLYAGQLGLLLLRRLDARSQHPDEDDAAWAGSLSRRHAIPIPKVIAAPLTLAVFIFSAYGLGCGLERLYSLGDGPARPHVRSTRPAPSHLQRHDVSDHQQLLFLRRPADHSPDAGLGSVRR